jgi:hypothetical protein
MQPAIAPENPLGGKHGDILGISVGIDAKRLVLTQLFKRAKLGVFGFIVYPPLYREP